MNVLSKNNKIKNPLFLLFLSFFSLNLFSMERPQKKTILILCMDNDRAEKLSGPLFDLANNLKNITQTSVNQYSAQASLRFNKMESATLNEYRDLLFRHDLDNVFEKYSETAGPKKAGVFLTLVKKSPDEIKKKINGFKKAEKIFILAEGDWCPLLVEALNGVDDKSVYAVLLLDPSVANFNFKKVENRVYNFYSKSVAGYWRKIVKKEDSVFDPEKKQLKVVNIECEYEKEKGVVSPVDFKNQLQKLLPKIPEMVFDIDKHYKINTDLYSVIFSDVDKSLQPIIVIKRIITLDDKEARLDYNYGEGAVFGKWTVWYPINKDFNRSEIIKIIEDEYRCSYQTFQAFKERFKKISEIFTGSGVNQASAVIEETFKTVRSPKELDEEIKINSAPFLQERQKLQKQRDILKNKIAQLQRDKKVVPQALNTELLDINDKITETMTCWERWKEKERELLKLKEDRIKEIEKNLKNKFEEGSDNYNKYKAKELESLENDITRQKESFKKGLLSEYGYKDFLKPTQEEINRVNKEAAQEAARELNVSSSSSSSSSSTN